MNNTPLISIVVPSFNQGHFIGETLQSLVDQDYTRLEVVVQDGCSKDNSVEVIKQYIAKYPEVFNLSIEKDSGHAQALNRGFRRTHGDILGFLNSDDTLFPGCLKRVAAEIDPAKGRYIVFGRSIFTGTGSPYVGHEHPAEFISHFEQLAIWKRGFNTIPQPSTFWHRKVMEKCGQFDETRNQGLDYLMFCKFSRHFFFHQVGELWSTYRMHPASVSGQKTEAQYLDLSVNLSRLCWGPWWSPFRWRCELSYWLHNRHLFEQARHHARLAEQALFDKRYIRMIIESLKTLTLSPKMAWHRLVYPVLARAGLVGMERLFFVSQKSNTATLIDKYPDHWIGPEFRQVIAIPKNATFLEYTLQHVPQTGGHHRTIHAQLLVNGKVEDRATISSSQHFALKADVSPSCGKECCVEIHIPEFFIPAIIDGNGDTRRLSAIMISTAFNTAANTSQQENNACG